MYKVSEFARMVNCSVKTVQRWDREGKLKAHRTPTNKRYYTHDQYLEYIGQKAPDDNGQVVVYLRVSSHSQKPDLANQRAAVEQFVTARGVAVDQWVEEIGSGLNYKRKQFNDLLRQVERGEIRQLVLAHKDRFVRFGYEWFEAYCERHGCHMLVMNQARLSPEQEMTQDLMTIIHCFSSRLYGLRRYKQKISRLVRAREDAA